MGQRVKEAVRSEGEFGNPEAEGVGHGVGNGGRCAHAVAFADPLGAEERQGRGGFEVVD